MTLREKLGLPDISNNRRQKNLYETYGVLDNPFPPANKTTGNPHHLTEADEEITQRVKRFWETGNSEVVVVLGTQGAGKTNLLEYYQRELPPLLSEQEHYYVIRYYSDPEPDFSAVVRRVFQELGAEHLKKMAQAAAELPAEKRQKAMALVRVGELREALNSLIRWEDKDLKSVEMSKLFLDYLLGQRIYKRHTDELGVQYRLDSTEARTQALHDVVYFSHAVGCLSGVFLFLDELEKIGGLPTQTTTKYLSAIRALIDALPEHLFLVLAMTPDAHRRYMRDLPALGGRLQNTVELQTLSKEDEALDLYRFYLEEKRADAKQDPITENWQPGQEEPLSTNRIRTEFAAMLKQSPLSALRGVTQRAFLSQLHTMTDKVFS